jgi:adenine-specific DNA-methyltransferase
MNLGEVERSAMLTSLILALDEVDNTLGHFVSYLNEWAPRSYKVMKMKVPTFIVSDAEHEVYCDDVFNILGDVECDLAYYDPPYGSNNEKMPPSRIRYAAYYHLWTTICLNDRPQLFGKVGRRADSSDHLAGSVFEEFRRNGSGRFAAVEAIERLLKHTQARYVILSYSSGGRATAEELHEILNGTGTILECVRVDYRRSVMATMRWTNEWVREEEPGNTEYLFLMKK